MQEKDKLHRGLEERHINLMALGAAIGVGLFFGSASTIKMAGPAIMLSYALGGVAVFLIMRALGEMAIHNPVAGSFSRYAQDYIGPLAGYLTGWTYWFVWIVACMAEITAVGVYMQVWFPDVPGWIWALSALAIMSSVNFIAVQAYGEFEFWFALIKVVAIVLMIVAGLGMIVLGLGNHGAATGIANLWSHGGFAPHGIKGVLMALPMVMFAYQGVEMIGLTAGEAKNPQKTLARAVDSVFWRVLIFYVGALFVIMSLYPWNELGTNGSPFVMTFQRMGIRAAAGIINFVVLTAALSSCNSGIFSTARMVYNLAQQGQALSVFAKVNKQGVPVAAVFGSVVLMLIGVLLNYLAPKEVFTWLTATATFGAVWTWGIILLSQYKFRQALTPRQVGQLGLRMPFFPYGSYIAGTFLLFVLGAMATFPDTRIALIVGPAWMALLLVVYFALGYNKQAKLMTARQLI